MTPSPSARSWPRASQTVSQTLGLCLSVAVAACGTAQGVPAAPLLPTGGAPVLGGNEPDVSGFEGDGVATIQTAPVEGMPFEQAAHLEVSRRPKSTWSVQLNLPNARAVSKGDVVHARFWARCLESMTGEGFADVKFELARAPWDQSMTRRVSYGQDWQVFDLPFTALRDFKPGEAKLSFQLGFDAQVMQLGGVQVLNYGPGFDKASLPFTASTYEGRDADAPWRAKAADRIEQLRKGDLTVRVVDADGSPVPGATVHAAMTQHAFKFGSAVVANAIAENQHPQYNQFIEDHFNEIVFENDLKWETWEGVGDPDDIDAALAWLGERGITARGHVIVWPGWDNLPDDLRSLEDQPEQLRQRVRERVTHIASTYRDRLADWDVMNEPFNNHDLMDIFGDEVMVEWFQLARQAAPDANLYINDWGILTGGGGDTNHQDHYYDTIKYLIDNGAPLDGIGLQGHFGATVTSPDKLLELLDRYAEFGKRIKVTELDIVMDDEEMRADYMRDFLTVMFSHEAVDGVLMWGFWANRHWKPEAAPFDADWNLKPHGQAWIDTVKGAWWTDTAADTDEQGRATVRGFTGDYEITVEHDGKTATAQPTLTRDGTTVEIVLK